jgi:hypothetical protein
MIGGDSSNASIQFAPNLSAREKQRLASIGLAPDSQVMKWRVSWLAAWLNGDLPNAKAQQRPKARIKRIIGLLQELQDALRPGTPLWRLPEVGRIEKNLETLTCRYRTWPRFGAQLDASRIVVAHMWDRGSFEETISLSLIEELLNAGLLRGLTLCETCRLRWVFRRGGKGKYCSTKCRQARYEATPERKLQKRKNAKRYYKTNLSSWKKQRRIR